MGSHEKSASISNVKTLATLGNNLSRDQSPNLAAKNSNTSSNMKSVTVNEDQNKTLFGRHTHSIQQFNDIVSVNGSQKELKTITTELKPSKHS